VVLVYLLLIAYNHLCIIYFYSSHMVKTHELGFCTTSVGDDVTPARDAYEVLGVSRNSTENQVCFFDFCF